jgi:acetolactate decarboxylase
MKEQSNRVFYQAKPFVALYDGVYEGVTTVREAKKHGRWGEGSPDGLNGEMVVIDGVFYHIDPTGYAHVLPDDAVICFAEIAHFEADETIKLPDGLTFANLGAFLDPKLTTVNAFWVLRFRGRFKMIQARSFAAPAKGPDGKWPPLYEVLAGENKFIFSDVDATLISFRSPPYITNFWGVPGYHIHCLTHEERKRGGHVLDFEIHEGVVEVHRLNHWLVDMPKDPLFDKTDLSYIIQSTGPCYPGCSSTPTTSNVANQGCGHAAK